MGWDVNIDHSFKKPGWKYGKILNLGKYSTQVNPVLFLSEEIYTTNYIVLAEGKKSKRAVARLNMTGRGFAFFNERGLNIFKSW